MLAQEFWSRSVGLRCSREALKLRGPIPQVLGPTQQVSPRADPLEPEVKVLLVGPADAAVHLGGAREVSETFLDVSGAPVYDDDAGEFGFPDWNGTLALRATVGDYRFTWQMRYIGSVEQDVDFIDDFGNALGSGDGTLADTCLGATLGDVDCKDVGFADDYYTHAFSFYYYGDVWTLGGGIRNVFDEEPPVVDPTEVLSTRNSPIGYGYDLNGRTYFLNIAANFQ